jgi:hypothetical protein
MKHRCLSLVLAGAIPAAFLAAQDPQPKDPQPKAPPAVESPSAEMPGVSRAEIERAIADLGSQNFRDRARAEHRLMAAGQAALEPLRHAAESGADPEMQWRARRLIRQIERGESALGLEERGRRPPTDPQEPRPWQQRPVDVPRRVIPEDMQRRFDELFQGLERDFGIDIPRRRFFSDPFFSDLDQQMSELMERARQGGGQSQGQSMSMQVGPDGVRVEVVERDDSGKEKKKVYEAPDLESFREQYPGVLGGGGLGVGMRPRGWFRQLPRLRIGRVDGDHDVEVDRDIDTDSSSRRDVDMVIPPVGERLGVSVQENIPEALRDYLGIDHGLFVESVQEDTLAQRLGLQTKDIILAIAGDQIGRVEDVARALRALEPGSEVVVEVLRRGKRQELRANKGDAMKQDAPRQGDASGDRPPRRRVLRERIR